MRFLFCTAFWLTSTSAIAQMCAVETADSLNAARIRKNATGLKILAGWGTLNIATGIVGSLAADDDEARRFHQMNAFWGGVNLTLAGVGIYRAHREVGKTRAPAESFKQYQRDRRIFAINAGLDVLYAGAGVYLIRRGNSTLATKPTLMSGYGKSLLLQGAVLFAFDAAMWAAHGRQSKAWQRAMEKIDVSDSGVGLRWRF